MALNVVERYLISVRGDRLSSHRRNSRYPTERGSTDRFPPRLRSTKRLKSRSAASVRVPRLATPPAWAQAPRFLDDLGHCTGSAAALTRITRMRRTTGPLWRSAARHHQ